MRYLERPGETVFPRSPLSFPPYQHGFSFGALENWLGALQVIPISAMEWQCNARWKLQPRILPDSVYFLFHNGHGRCQIGDQHYILNSGDLLLIPRGATHSIEQDRGVEFHLSAVHFHAQISGGINLIELLGFPFHIRRSRQSHLLGELTRQMVREHALQAPGHTRVLEAGISQVLFHLIRHYGKEFRPVHRTDNFHELRRLLPAFDYLEQNIGDNKIRICDLAKKVFVSEVQFRKLFRRITGMSPVRFIQSRRIDRACRLFRSADLSVEQVAAEVGFSDPSFFARIFKIWTHATPGQYRAGPL
jgi:AraC family transcriptional regulator of arabinose operon